MSESKDAYLPPDLVYGTIRQEILDQKKCQFQLFSMSVTVTAAILAYGAATHVGSVLYLAPMILNILSLIIIINKATSIQRMVGYLKIMEQGFKLRPWKWESHLDKFRAQIIGPIKASVGESRKHRYVTMIALMLATLNLLCAGLCWFGSTSQSASRLNGWLDIVVLILAILGPAWAYVIRNTLIKGEHSSNAIAAKWEQVLKDDDAENDEGKTE